jgi:hypothetical protein
VLIGGFEVREERLPGPFQEPFPFEQNRPDAKRAGGQPSSEICLSLPDQIGVCANFFGNETIEGKTALVDEVVVSHGEERLRKGLAMLASNCFEFQAAMSFGCSWVSKYQIEHRCGRLCLSLFDNLREMERFGLKFSINEFGTPAPNFFGESFVVLTRRAFLHLLRSIAVSGDVRKAGRTGG